jgi:uncharacterized protein YqjF (DUF2071 family)
MTFLSAEWRKLAMANYAIDPALLQSYLPQGVELDLHEGVCYVSLVAFMFQKTRILGIPVPFHINFEEVNLRFYVRKNTPEGWRRGVVFIKEIVPKPAIALVARTIYREPYGTMPMRHTWTIQDDQMEITYRWKSKKQWYAFSVQADAKAVPIAPNSVEEFITEHYFGYTRWDAHVTKEYGVEHPRWEVYPVYAHQISVDFEDLYGSKFAFLNKLAPASVLLAEGSAVRVLMNQDNKG